MNQQCDSERISKSNCYMKIIAVTGAAGALGLALVSALRESGCSVRVLVTPRDDISRLHAVVDHLVVGSVEDEQCCDELVRGADAVINCAALLPNSLHLGEQKYRSVNVDGALNILRSANKHRLGKAVFLSTIGVVDHTLRRTIQDLFEYRTIFLDAYGKSKIELEKKLLEQSQKTSIEVLIVRPAFIYGPNSLGLWTPILDQVKAGTFKLLGNGEAFFPVVFEDDLAHYIVEMLLNNAVFRKDRVVITAGPYDLTMKHLFEMISQDMECPPPGRVPVWLAYLAAVVAERMPKKLRVGPLALLSRRRVKEYSIGYDLAPILDETSFGYSAKTPLRDGISRMVKAYRERNP